MLSIAVCDDNGAELTQIAEQLEKYKTAADFGVEYKCYDSGKLLLNDIISGCSYDLVFLDIVMPEVTGMDIAKEIYKRNKAAKIIFLTVSPEFAVDSYSVSALDYIIKPITEERFAAAMEKFKESRRQLEYETIIIQEKSSIIHIPLFSLCYVEVFDHRLIYHLSDLSSVKCRQSLSEIESTLNRSSKFFKSHRSCIVNMDYIKRLDSDGITMVNGERLPLSRTRYKALADLFLKYKLGGVKYEYNFTRFIHNLDTAPLLLYVYAAF